MAFKGKAVVLGDLVLAFFDIGIRKLNNLAAIRTDQVIVMIAVIKFEHSLAAVKLTANQDAGLFKLRENAIHGRQTDVHVFVDQGSIHIFSAKMALVSLAKNIENLETREGRF